MSRVVVRMARRASGLNCGTAAWCVPASASRVCFGWRGYRAVTDAKVLQHLAARLALRLLPISCSASSLPPRRIACGSPTSPLSRLGRASSIWRWSLMSTAGASSAGPWPTTSAASWSSKPSTWRSGDGDQRRAPSITRTRGVSTPVWPAGDGCAKPDSSARWGVVAIASTTRRLRASSPRSNASCGLVTASRRAAPPDSRYSITSKGSPTPTGGIRRSGISPPPRSRGGGRLSRSSSSSYLSTKPG